MGQFSSRNKITKYLFTFSTTMHLFTYGEYLIKDGNIPSFLYHEFQQIFEEDKLHVIHINVTMSHIEGTLMYIVDKRGYQLIVSIYESVAETMKIEYRGEEHYMSLIDTCGCFRCRYQPLSFIFELKEIIHIHCNKKINKIDFKGNNKLINKAYPLLSTTENYGAALWLVNTPAHGEFYPNNEQLTGCFHDVSYNGQSLSMQTFGEGISKICRTSCDKNICNSGECYETFSREPFCDCTNSFMNGPYCNSTGLVVPNHMVKSVHQNFQFKLLKLTWRSNSTKIFHLSNRAQDLIINTEGFDIYVLYQQKVKPVYSIKSIINDTYEYFSNSILILSFEKNCINIQFFIKGKVGHDQIPVLLDLSKEYFTSMELLNGNGVIDAVYKKEQSDYQWIKIDLHFLKKNDNLEKYSKAPTRQIKNHWKEIGYKFKLVPIINEDLSRIVLNDKLAEKIEKNLYNEQLEWRIILIAIESILLIGSVLSICFIVTHLKMLKVKNKTKNEKGDFKN